MTVRRNCYATEPFFFSLVPALDDMLTEKPASPNPKARKCFAPPLDVIESDQAYTVLLDVPGVPKDSLSVHFDEVGDLIVSAKPASAEDGNSDKTKYVHRERRSCQEFERRVRLGKDADQESVEAKLADGVLEVRVRRSVPSKKTINIY